MTSGYDKADERGVPSLVWRAGQDRRLEMIKAAAEPSRLTSTSRMLDSGCGIGMYVKALRQLSPYVFGTDLELEWVEMARQHSPFTHVAAGECLPYPSHVFDVVLSHEVIEHVQDDALAVAEMVRVLKVNGRAVIFCPNRLYPFETHGHYWRGKYYFGNTPFINYLPDLLRNKFAPHVRAYTIADLRKLVEALPVKIVQHTQIYPGFDNLVSRRPQLGALLRRLTYRFEQTPLRLLGLSHLLVIEKTGTF